MKSSASVLPKTIFLPPEPLASCKLKKTHKYRITMSFENKGDEGATLKGLGFFWCTDAAKGHDGDSDRMGWLNKNKKTFKARKLVGSKLYAFLLLDVKQLGEMLEFGPDDGPDSGTGKDTPFNSAAWLWFRLMDENQFGYPQLLYGPHEKIGLNTFDTKKVKHLSFPLKTSASPAAGFAFRIPNIQKNVCIYILNSGGEVLGKLDAADSGQSYWLSSQNEELFLLAAIVPMEGSKAGKAGMNDSTTEWVFNIGDPRTDGSMTVTEIDP